MKWRYMMIMMSLAFTGFGVVASGHGQTQSGAQPARVKLIHADEARGAMQQGQIVRRLVGNVHMVHGKTTIRCQQATEWPAEQRWVLWGDVIIDDDEKIIRADQVTYLERQRVYEAFRNVSVVSDSTTLTAQQVRYFIPQRRAVAVRDVKITNLRENIEMTSQQAEYLRNDEYIKATIDPVLVQYDSSGLEETRITGDEMESFQRGERFVVTKNVKITHREIRAECDHAEYLTSTEKLVLSTEPVAWQQNNELRGETIELYLAGRKLKKVHVINNAHATLKDTTMASRKPDVLTGQTLTAHFDHDQLQRVVVSGTATCVYHIYEGRVYKGQNRTQADHITLYLWQNNIHRVVFESDPGRATGSFSPPGPAGGENGQPAGNRTAGAAGTGRNEPVP